MNLAGVIVILTLLCTSLRVDSLKILALFPYPGKSHFAFFEPLMKALAVKGHQVTVVGHHPQKLLTKNYTDITLNSTSESHGDMMDLHFITGSRFEKFLGPLLRQAHLGKTYCHRGLSNQKLQDFLASEPKVDLVIAELFMLHCFLGVVHKVKAPLVGISSSSLMPWHYFQLGLSGNPAFIPNIFTPFSDRMGFWERVENVLVHVFHQVLFETLMRAPSNLAAKKYLGGDLPDLDDIAANASLILVNNHFTYTIAKPLAPNCIEVAGMHLGKAKKIELVSFASTENLENVGRERRL